MIKLLLTLDDDRGIAERRALALRELPWLGVGAALGALAVWFGLPQAFGPRAFHRTPELLALLAAIGGGLTGALSFSGKRVWRALIEHPEARPSEAQTIGYLAGGGALFAVGTLVGLAATEAAGAGLRLFFLPAGVGLVLVLLGAIATVVNVTQPRSD